MRTQIALLFLFWYNVFSRVLRYVFWARSGRTKKCEYNEPVQVSCRDISSCTGSTVGFHHRCQTSVFLKNLCCPWDPEHWTHQNHAANQSTGKECTSPFNKSRALFHCLQSFWRDDRRLLARTTWQAKDVRWRGLPDESKERLLLHINIHSLLLFT